MARRRPSAGWFTCLRDSQDHAVTDDEFMRCNEPPAGYVQAICGHEVMLAPAATPPCPTCPKCVALLASRRRIDPAPEWARSAWQRILRRLINSRAPANDHRCDESDHRGPGTAARHSWPVSGAGKGHDGLLTIRRPCHGAR